MSMATFQSFALEDLTRWIQQGGKPVTEEGMRRLAQAAQHAACRQPSRTAVERRRGGRVTLPRVLQMTPVLADGLTQAGAPFAVVSRRVSERGIDFFSRVAIPHRYVRLDLVADRDQVGVVVQLRWCRFSRGGIYENGGSFVHYIIQPQTLDFH